MAKYSLQGRVVLITGGARGIGLDAATRLLEKGACVALVDRDAAALAACAKNLGDRVATFVADVADLAAMQAAVAAVVERFGGLDVVVAGAGISGKPSPVATLDPAEFKRVIDINLMGVYYTVLAALPYVVARKGYILPIASVAALVPSPTLAAYVASKHAVEGFARTLRMELAHTGTTVGIGYFSFIDTEMVRNATADSVGGAGFRAIPSLLRKPIPVGRAGKAVVDGIENRSRWVCAPKWVSGLITLRGFSAQFEDAAARMPQLTAALRQPE